MIRLRIEILKLFIFEFVWDRSSTVKEDGNEHSIESITDTDTTEQ